MLCDLSSLKSVNSFCDVFLEKYKRLDVLINNAGTLKSARRETDEGFELTFGVNYLAPFLLTQRLMPLLQSSAPSRIINVSSTAHRWGRIHFDDINTTNCYSALKCYSQSKLAGVMFTYALAERLFGTGVTVNAADPGIVGTDIVVNRETGFGTFFSKCHKLLFKSPEKGAETIIYLASSPDVESVTGKFFVNRKAVPSCRRSYDKEAAKRLWELSEQMTGLSGGDIDARAEYYEEDVSADGTAMET
jgi:NAD(P)-dependent dehydrogenase (short-subunit alcohol dehydrogenase family)